MALGTEQPVEDDAGSSEGKGKGKGKGKEKAVSGDEDEEPEEPKKNKGKGKDKSLLEDAAEQLRVDHCKGGAMSDDNEQQEQEQQQQRRLWSQWQHYDPRYLQFETGETPGETSTNETFSSPTVNEDLEAFRDPRYDPQPNKPIQQCHGNEVNDHQSARNVSRDMFYSFAGIDFDSLPRFLRYRAEERKRRVVKLLSSRDPPPSNMEHYEFEHPGFFLSPQDLRRANIELGDLRLGALPSIYDLESIWPGIFPDVPDELCLRDGSGIEDPPTFADGSDWEPVPGPLQRMNDVITVNEILEECGMRLGTQRMGDSEDPYLQQAIAASLGREVETTPSSLQPPAATDRTRYTDEEYALLLAGELSHQEIEENRMMQQMFDRQNNAE